MLDLHWGDGRLRAPHAGGKEGVTTQTSPSYTHQQRRAEQRVADPTQSGPGGDVDPVGGAEDSVEGLCDL